MLTATAFHAAGSGEKAVLGDSGTPEEVEKGLLLLIASDTPGLQVHASLIILLIYSFTYHPVQTIQRSFMSICLGSYAFSVGSVKRSQHTV